MAASRDDVRGGQDDRGNYGSPLLLAPTCRPSAIDQIALQCRSFRHGDKTGNDPYETTRGREPRWGCAAALDVFTPTGNDALYDGVNIAMALNWSGELWSSILASKSAA